jgi:hypothetical protein
MSIPAPGYSLIIVGNCLHLGGGLYCKALLSIGIISATCHKDVFYHSCPFLIPTYLEEGMTQSKEQHIQNGDRDAKLLLFLVNLWIQVVLFSKSG